jgi:hypothetical protein
LYRSNLGSRAFEKKKKTTLGTCLGVPEMLVPVEELVDRDAELSLQIHSGCPTVVS